MAENQGHITEIVSPKAIDDLKEIIRLLPEGEAKMKLLNTQAGQIEKQISKASTSIAQSNKLLKEYNAVIGEINDSAVKQATAMKQLMQAQLAQAQATLAQSRAATEETKQVLNNAKANEVLERTKAKLEARQKRLEEQAKRQASAYNQLKIKTKEAEQAAADALVTYGKTSQEFIRLNTSYQQYRKQLDEANKTLGKTNSQLGQSNQLVHSFNLILLETPSVAAGFRVFLMAIGNNIAEFNKQIKIARSEGKSWGTILGQLGGSLFSFQSLLLLGITALTVYGGQLFETAEGMKILTKQSDILTRVNKNTSDSYARTAAELRIMKDRFFDAATTMKEKQGIVKELNEKYGDTIGKISGINEAEEFFIKRSDAYVQALLIRAQIEGAYQAVAENTKKVLDAQSDSVENLASTGDKAKAWAKTLFAPGGIMKLLTGAGQKEAGSRIEESGLINFENLRMQASKSNKILEAFITDNTKKLNELSKKMRLEFGGGGKEPKEKDFTNEALSAKKAAYEANAANVIASMQREADAMKALVDDETEDYDTRYAAAYEYYNLRKDIAAVSIAKEINILNAQQAEIDRISAKNVQDRTNEERTLLLQKGNIQEQIKAKISEHLTRVANLEHDHNKDIRALDKKRAKSYEDALKKINEDARLAIQEITTLNEEAAIQEIFDENAKGQQIDTIKRKWLKKSLNDLKAYLVTLKSVKGIEQSVIISLINKINQAQEEVIGDDREQLMKKVRAVQEYAQIGLGIANNLIDIAIRGSSKYQEELDAIDATREAKIAAAEAEATSIEDKNRRIAQVEADLQKRREEIAAKQRSEAKRRAIALKAAAIFEILIMSSVGIVEAIATQNYFKAAALATAAITQSAAVAAAPIPEYKRGTPPGGKPEAGFAIVGDGGVSEVIQRRDGSTQITPNTPTKVWLDKGETVIPSINEALDRGVSLSSANQIGGGTPAINLGEIVSALHTQNTIYQTEMHGLKQIARKQLEAIQKKDRFTPYDALRNRKHNS